LEDILPGLELIEMMEMVSKGYRFEKGSSEWEMIGKEKSLM